MKTLASCSLSEFMPQAYRVREVFHTLYAAIGAEKRYADFLQAAQESDTKSRGTLARKYIEDMFWAIMAAEPEKTVALLAALTFSTPEEAERFSPVEALTVLMDCLTSESVMAFFINAERLGGSDTEGILHMLTLLWLAASDVNTSPTASQSSTSDSAEPTPSPDTSANASERSAAVQ